MVKPFELRFILKVLPREYGRRYTWSFIFQKDFWRKKKEVKISGKNPESEGNISGEYTSRPAIEAISLEMKQQELDGRYVIYNLSASIWYMMRCLFLISY